MTMDVTMVCPECPRYTSGRCPRHSALLVSEHAAPLGWPVVPSVSMSAASVTLIGHPICPDLLSIDDIGEADGFRGRVVRGFFWVLDRLLPEAQVEKANG